MAYAQLRDQGIDRPHLHAMPSTGIAQLRRVDVIVAIGYQEGQGGEALDDALACLGAGKSLQQLLQHESGDDERLAVFQRANQRAYLGGPAGRIAPQSQRPHARVDEQAQVRERSAL